MGLNDSKMMILQEIKASLYAIFNLQQFRLVLQ